MMTDIDDQLAQILRAHVPAIATAAPGTRLFGMPDGLELHAELGLDPIALAEVALAIEDALEIDLDVDEIAACLTLGHLSRLIHAKVKAAGGSANLTPFGAKPAL